jgi:hypothetical protein
VSRPELSRRQAFAEMVLHGNPTHISEPPEEPGTLAVYLEDLADLHRYRDQFLPGGKVWKLPGDREPGRLLAYAEGTWAGWQLDLRVRVPDRAPETRLDDATREQLQQLVDEAEAAREAGDESRFLHEHGVDEPAGDDRG